MNCVDDIIRRQKIVWLDLLLPTPARSVDEKSCNTTAVSPPRCPIHIFGHRRGVFYFCDARGQFRRLTMRQMENRCEFVALFYGDVSWLERSFPCIGTAGHGRIARRGWSFAAAREHVLRLGSARLTVVQIQSYEITTRGVGRRDRADRARAAAGVPARVRR